MILVNQQNFTTNLITELPRYKVSGESVLQCPKDNIQYSDAKPA